MEQIDAQLKSNQSLPATLRELFSPSRNNESPLAIYGMLSQEFDAFSKQNTTFRPPTLQLHPYLLLNERWMMSANLIFLSSSLQICRMQAEWFINDNLTFVAGRFYSPIGFYTERLRLDWVLKTPDPPLMFNQVYPQQLYFDGVQFRGARYLVDSPVKLEYVGFVANGLSVPGSKLSPRVYSDLSNFTDTTVDVNGAKAFGGRLGLSIPAIGFIAGLSGLANQAYDTGRPQPEPLGRRRELSPGQLGCAVRAGEDRPVDAVQADPSIRLLRPGGLPPVRQPEPDPAETGGGLPLRPRPVRRDQPRTDRDQFRRLRASIRPHAARPESLHDSASITGSTRRWPSSSRSSSIPSWASRRCGTTASSVNWFGGSDNDRSEHDVSSRTPLPIAFDRLSHRGLCRGGRMWNSVGPHDQPKLRFEARRPGRPAQVARELRGRSCGRGPLVQALLRLVPQRSPAGRAPVQQVQRCSRAYARPGLSDGQGVSPDHHVPAALG